MRIIVFILLFCCSAFLSAADFTVGSYNAGCLSGHYDYIRAVAMEKLMQERYAAEPEQMARNEKMQQLALTRLFAADSEARSAAEAEWEREDYDAFLDTITADPHAPDSPNASWNQRSEAMLSTYHIRPIVIYDDEVRELLIAHLRRMTQSHEGGVRELVEAGCALMAKDILGHYLPFDLICFQEADYLDAAFLPPHYRLFLSSTAYSRNGIAWNTNRFEWLWTQECLDSRALCVYLKDRQTGKTVHIASCHLKGCDPYRVVIDPKTGLPDSKKGDEELRALLNYCDYMPADVTIIGMDSNVTSLHPRLRMMKDAGYTIDDQHYIEPTCTNPYSVLNTRIDWIALKSKGLASLTNVPVLSVGLNHRADNVSDHKPIAAKVTY